MCKGEWKRECESENECQNDLECECESECVHVRASECVCVGILFDVVGILFDVRVSIHILRTHARRVS